MSDSHAQPAPAESSPGMPVWTLVIVSIALFMAALDNLVVGIALPQLRIDLGGTLESLEWTVNAYTLTFAVLLITGAALGDRFGRRRTFMIGLGIFTGASAMAALAPSFGVLVAARAIQGAGAAIILPLTLTILAEAVPPQKRGVALGIWSGVMGLGIALGPFVGGAVVEGLAWQWIFWLNVPIGLVLLPLSLRHLSESWGPNRQLDIPGVMLAGIGLLGVTFGVVRSQALGWTSGTVVASLAIGGVFIVAFVLWQLRAPAPMLPMRFFRSRGFTATNLAAFLMFFGVFGSIFFTSQYFQTSQEYGPLMSGLLTLPWTATPMLVSPIAGMLSDKIGDRPLVVVGLALQAIGIFWQSQTYATDAAYLSLVPPFIVTGVGMSLVFPSLPSAILCSVRPEEAGQASGAHNAVREFGTALGVAVLGSVFAASGSYASPQAFNDGLVAALPVGAAFLAVAAVVALLIPSRVSLAAGAEQLVAAETEGSRTAVPAGSAVAR